MSDLVNSRSSALGALGRSAHLVLAAVLVALLSTVVVGTARADYTAPTSVVAQVMGMDTVQVTWKPVTGAPRYRVGYSTSSSFSGEKFYPAATSTSPLTTASAWVTGLVRGTKYYFRVWVIDATTGARVSPFSATVSGTPAYLYTAPKALIAANVGGTSVDLEWSIVLGSPAYRLRATSSEAPTVITDTGSDGKGRLVGLTKGKAYTIQVAVLLPKTDSSPAVRMSPYSSVYVKVTTSNYSVDAPTEVKLVKQEPYAITLGWTEPEAMQSTFRYLVQYATNSAMTKGLKSAPLTDQTQLRIPGLVANTNYYMRVRVVAQDGTAKSDRSDTVQAKTPTPYGFIAGKVTGAPFADLVATAYLADGTLIKQATVNSKGEYKLRLRPGTYRVQLTYVGTGSYTSLWALTGSKGGRIISESSPVPVSLDTTSTPPPITLGPGARVKGVISDQNGLRVRAVDVSARSAWTDARDVIAMTLNSDDGSYELRGLADGSYWLRMIYNAGDGFLAKAIKVTITDGVITGIQESTEASPRTASVQSPFGSVDTRLAPMPFRKTYAAHIYGSKTVGTKLTSKVNPWLAGQYPTTYATMKLQWKRNGAPITGATGSTYRLTSADRGKYITLWAQASKYGYITGTVTSTSYKVS
jgi:hypothetical protein